MAQAARLPEPRCDRAVEHAPYVVPAGRRRRGGGRDPAVPRQVLEPRAPERLCALPVLRAEPGPLARRRLGERARRAACRLADPLQVVVPPHFTPEKMLRPSVENNPLERRDKGMVLLVELEDTERERVLRVVRPRS